MLAIPVVAFLNTLSYSVMINPHMFYCAGFLMAMLLFSLGWSEAYPKLSGSLTLFLLTTLVVHLGIGWRLRKIRQIKFYHTSPVISPVLITALLYLLWTADFVYEGGIPVLKILLNQSYDYRLFGVPSLHVFTVTFSSFYIQYLFHTYLSQRKRLLLFLYILNSFAAILIYSRSMLFFNLAGSFFLYLFYADKTAYRRLLILLPVGVIILYFFGVAGNKRVAFESGKPYDTVSFLDIGRATPGCHDSGIPNEFFWTYIYISSPLANLQANINSKTVPPITFLRVLECINNEYLFESLSKRINAAAGIERENEITIKHPFNVSTVYSRSYSYLGWAGVIGMGLFVVLLPVLYNKMLSRDNPYVLTGQAILCTVYLFMFYDNTIRLMGLGFQLVYPLVFPLGDRLYNRWI